MRDITQGNNVWPGRGNLPPEPGAGQDGNNANEQGNPQAQPPPQGGPQPSCGGEPGLTWGLMTGALPTPGHAAVVLEGIPGAVRQESAGAVPQGGLQPVPGMARRMTSCCCSVPG